MSICQTIRSLVAVRARLIVLAAVGFGVLVLAKPAGAQGRPGGMMGHRGSPRGFMAPAPTMTRPPHIGLQLGLGGRWWDDGKIGKKLSLRDDQKRRMDDIFEANKPVLQTLYGNLQREEARLASMPPGDMQDETRVFAAIDRVAQARTELEKANAHTLVQIRQQLDPAQLDQLDREIANSR